MLIDHECEMGSERRSTHDYKGRQVRQARRHLSFVPRLANRGRYKSIVVSLSHVYINIAIQASHRNTSFEIKAFGRRFSDGSIHRISQWKHFGSTIPANRTSYFLFCTNKAVMETQRALCFLQFVPVNVVFLFFGVGTETLA